MADLDENFEDIFSLEDFVKVMSQLQLEDDITCDSLPPLPTTTSSIDDHHIPVLTGRRTRARATRPFLTHPFSAKTYRDKIYSRSLQNPVHDDDLPSSSPPLQHFSPSTQNSYQTPVNHQVQDPPRLVSYSTTSANQSAQLSSRQNTYQNKSVTKQYHQKSSRNFTHSSSNSLRTQIPKYSSQVKVPGLSTYKDFPYEFSQNSTINLPYSAKPISNWFQYPPPPYKTSRNISSSRTAQFPDNSTVANNNFQFPQISSQNNPAPSNTTDFLDYIRFPYNNLSTNQSVHFPYGSSSYDEAGASNNYCQMSQNTLSSSSNQTLRAQVPSQKVLFNHEPTITGSQDFSSPFLQNSFQNVSNSTSVNYSFQFPNSHLQYSSPLANQGFQTPQFQYQNDSAQPNKTGDNEFCNFPYNNLLSNQSVPVHYAQDPYKSNSVSSNKTVNNQLTNNTDHHHQYQSAQVPYRPNSLLLTSNKTVKNQLSNNTDHHLQYQSAQVPYTSNSVSTNKREANKVQHNIPTADYQALFPSSQCLFESASVNSSTQIFPKTTVSKRKRGRNQTMR